MRGEGVNEERQAESIAQTGETRRRCFLQISLILGRKNREKRRIKNSFPALAVRPSRGGGAEGQHTAVDSALLERRSMSLPLEKRATIIHQNPPRLLLIFALIGFV